jgi:hypothetical protein
MLFALVVVEVAVALLCSQYAHRCSRVEIHSVVAVLESLVWQDVAVPRREWLGRSV